jgi:hypothetical protein
MGQLKFEPLELLRLSCGQWRTFTKISLDHENYSHLLRRAFAAIPFDFGSKRARIIAQQHFARPTLVGCSSSEHQQIALRTRRGRSGAFDRD